MAQASLALGLASGLTARISGEPGLCVVVSATAGTAALATLFGFFFDGLGVRAAMVALTIHAVCLIVTFAGVYHGYGLAGDHGNPTWGEAIYLSVVVWTTLGFGDYLPKAETQLIVAAEALLGYIFFGLIVGLVGSYLSASKARATSGEAPAAKATTRAAVRTG